MPSRPNQNANRRNRIGGHREPLSPQGAAPQQPRQRREDQDGNAQEGGEENADPGDESPLQPPEEGFEDRDALPRARAEADQFLRQPGIRAMEERILGVLRQEIRAQAHPAQAPAPNLQLPGQSMVGKALYDIPKLNEKEFDIWLSYVCDAFIGAGMGAMFRVASFPLDSLATLEDIQEVRAYPLWLTNAAWTALRRSVGSDQAAYARSMSVNSGDVIALLRSLRTFYERRAVPLLTQLRKDLIRVNISDYPDFKHYTAALELIFAKLAALGDNVSDNVRRFHLLEGLGDEYHAIVSSVVAYEGQFGRPADFAKRRQF